MQLCHFMLALSVGLSGVSAMPGTVVRHVKRITSATTRPVAGGHLWGRGDAGVSLDKTFSLAHGVRTWHGEPVGQGDVSERLATGRDLAGLAAPFAVVSVDDGGRLSVATDHVGLRHVYAVRGDGWAAVSTSARELADLVDAPLDRGSIGTFRLVGHHLGTSTPYAGVTKLGPGQIWRLADGELTTESYPRAAPEPGLMKTSAAVHLHADRLRRTVEGFLDAYPGGVLELSGGLDSRMVLAAIPPGRRKEFRALTLTYPGSSDLPVATSLARRYGMKHQTIDLCALEDVPPDVAYGAAVAAAVRLDAAGSPLGAAVLNWVERQVDPGPRLGGHGGELARGAYYLQRQHPRVEPVLVDRLARWWVWANAVPDEVLVPEFAAESREHTSRRLHEIFAGYQTDWLTAADEFYLTERLHRWAGLTLTDAATSIVVANPLLDPGVLAVARTVPPEDRMGSRYAVRVLDRLDPDLARLPLSSGLRPIALSRRITLSRQLGENTLRGFTNKAVGKLSRHLWRTSRPAAGVGTLARAVTVHLREYPDLLSPAADTGLLSGEWVERYLSGQAEASPATLDLLLNLVVAAR